MDGFKINEFLTLKKLAETRDSLAIKVFKEEIIKRFESGHPIAIKYILREKLLNYLSSEEKKDVIERSFETIVTNTTLKLSDEAKFGIFSELFKVVRETGLIKKHFLALLKFIDTLSDEYKFYSFVELLEGVEEKKLIENYGFTLMASLDKVSGEYKSQIQKIFFQFLKNLYDI